MNQLFEITFNEKCSIPISRIEQALIKKLLAEIYYAGGDMTDLMLSEYNRFQIIQGIHRSSDDTSDHFTVSLYNNFHLKHLPRTSRDVSSLFHFYMNDEYDRVTNISVVKSLKIGRR